MKPKVAMDRGQQDMFRARLDQFIDMNHELVVVAGEIDWDRLAVVCGEKYSDGPGHPPLPVRLMAGLHILKYAFDLSDEQIRFWYLAHPYFQYFCGEEFFRHAAPLDRSSLTRWRQRMGDEKMRTLLQESLDVACRTEAAKRSNFRGVIVDTTVQPKNVCWPVDAKLIHKALGHLVKQANSAEVKLRQSFARSSRRALQRHRACAHAKKYELAKEQLEQLKTFLGSVVKEIGRKIKDRCDLQEAFREPLRIAERVLTQRPRDGAGRHIHAVHAPEVECIVKGKAHRPCEFGVKVSVATPIRRPAGGQFILDARALPGNPYDGKTLEKVLPALPRITGVPVNRVLADRGYRGDHAPPEYKGKVFVTGQRRNITPAVRKLLKRRNAVEPVIGHAKSGHRMERNYLAHEQGDAINAVLAAVGYNFHLLFKWVKSEHDSTPLKRVDVSLNC